MTKASIQRLNGVYIVKSLLRILLETISAIWTLLIPAQRTNITQIVPRDDKILSKPATVLARAIKAGELKSEQVVESFITQIERVNPVINAVVCKHYHEALRRAREIDQIIEDARANPAVAEANKHLLASPLLGVPFTCKESVALAGAPYTTGLHLRRSVKATQSNPGVERLSKQGGLIPLAQTNTPCMNTWYDAYNLLYGRTLNPYDLSRIPGGSSGGEGAILASSGSCLGIGSDLSGSIRIPANFCGVFGHKPTPRAISAEGMFPTRTCDDLCAVGPMARYACDLRPALELMLTNEEARMKMRLDEPVNLRKIKIYYCEDLGDPTVSRCDSDVRIALHAAVQHLKSSHRMETREVVLEEFRYGMLLWKAEVEGHLPPFPQAPDGLVRFNPLWQFVKSLVGLNDIPFATMLALALDHFGPKENSPVTLHLKKKGEQLRKRFNELVGEDGVLIMPTFPQVAPKHAMSYFQIINIAYTGVINVLHAPVTQCPMGKSKSSGLPVGLQLIAGQHQDRLTLAVACELDKAFQGWQPAE